MKKFTGNQSQSGFGQYCRIGETTRSCWLLMFLMKTSMMNMGQKIFCGTAFALLVVLTVSNAQAQNYNIYKPESLKPTPAQIPKNTMLQNNMPQLPQQAYQPQQHPAVIPATAVMPIANPLKPAPVAMPNHNHHVVTTPPVRYEPSKVVQPVVPANHITVNSPHVHPEPQKTIVVEQPQVIVIQQQPKKTLLDKLLDKIF